MANRQVRKLPSAVSDRLGFLLRLLLDPYILSAFVAAFLASLAWMAAMTKFELNYAYPFTSLNFVLVALLSAWLFMEPITWPRIAGVSMIVLGTVVSSRG